MWIYLSFMRRTQRENWFIEHPVGIREITGLTLHPRAASLERAQRNRCGSRNPNRNASLLD